MRIPVGYTQDGTLVFTTSPEEDRAVALFQQLQAWSAKGYDPQLWATQGGWLLILDMTKWGQVDISERSHKMCLRFNSNVCETPQAAIEDALKVIQP